MKCDCLTLSVCEKTVLSVKKNPKLASTGHGWPWLLIVPVKLNSWVWFVLYTHLMTWLFVVFSLPLWPLLLFPPLLLKGSSISTLIFFCQSRFLEGSCWWVHNCLHSAAESLHVLSPLLSCTPQQSVIFWLVLTIWVQRSVHKKTISSETERSNHLVVVS